MCVSMLRALRISLLRELKTIIGDRLYLSVIWILPLVAIIFFSIMFYGGAIKELPLAVVDNDCSAVSRKLVDMIDATRGVCPNNQPMSIPEAEDMMLRGEVVGVLYIDKDFEHDIYAGVPTRLSCYMPGTSLSASGIVERDLQLCVRALSETISQDKLLQSGVDYNNILVDINRINLLINTISNPYMNYGYYLAPIFMFMAVIIFTVVATTYAVGRELYYATASEWRGTAPNSMVGALIGKLLPITISMVVVMQLVFAILFGIMGMECMGSYLFLTLSSILFILAYQSVALFITTMTANLRLSLSLGGGYSVMAFTFSGITFPVMAMYSAARVLSKLFPLSYFSDIFIDQVMRGAPIEFSTNSLWALMAFLLLSVVSIGRLDMITRCERYWCRD